MHRRVLWLVLALAAAAMLPGVASAQAVGDEVGTGVVALGVWDWVNLLLRLLAVVAVIWGAFWALRWYNRRIQTGYGVSRSLEVLETRALGPNRSMQLVRVGRRAVLVGVTADRINQLLEIDDPDEVERLAQAALAEQGRGPALNRVIESMSRLATTRSTRGSATSPTTRPSSPQASAPTRPAATQQVQANAAYRSARIAELQRAIEDARRGTSFEQAR